MLDALHAINYFHLVIVGIIGFAFGSLWYTVLFGKTWAAEMKISPEAPKEPMAPYMIKGFIFTLISTWGLALLIVSHGTNQGCRGAAFGAVVGLLVVGARKLNSGVWEKASCKLQAINLAHEVLLFAIQGAILAVWH